MKKTQLLMLFLLSAIIFQGCKKDVETTASTISDQILAATINGSSWIPDTVNATIKYNTASKTKTFNVEGTIAQKRVTMAISLLNSTDDGGFTIGTYRVDTTSKVKLTFYTQQLVGGSYVFVQTGVVEPGSGSVIITAIDTDKKLLTGTYSFTAKKVNYDADGNYVSVEISQILSGTFTNLPYTYSTE